jgi:hypothetical protein
MLISKDNSGKVIGGMETYVSDHQIVNVNASRNFTTISTQDKKTGAVKSETFFGKPLMPPGSRP